MYVLIKLWIFMRNQTFRLNKLNYLHEYNNTSLLSIYMKAYRTLYPRNNSLIQPTLFRIFYQLIFEMYFEKGINIFLSSIRSLSSTVRFRIWEKSVATSLRALSAAIPDIFFYVS